MRAQTPSGTRRINSGILIRLLSGGRQWKRPHSYSPARGSQAVGMGADLYREFDFVREIFDMMEEVTRINISRLCFKGPMEELTQTVNLQPAVTAVNLACLAVLQRENVPFDFCAGHSLGEYSALNAAGRPVAHRHGTARLPARRTDAPRGPETPGGHAGHRRPHLGGRRATG